MKRLAIAAVFLALAGCATAPPLDPHTVTQFHDRPVAVRCVPDPPIVKPTFADSDAAIKAAANPFENVKARKIGRLQHQAYEGELEAALKGCTG